MSTRTDQMDAPNLNIRMDKATGKKLNWLSEISHWPKSMIVRLLIRKAEPSDLGLNDISLKDEPQTPQ